MAKCLTLMYHDITNHDASESGFQNKTALKYKVSAKNFEEHVKRIREYLDEKKLPDATIQFSFDDGGESFLTLAAPILEKYRFKGIFFISTGYIGSKGFLDVNQIRELSNRGHIIGSHSHSHPERMTVLTPEEIHDEWTMSQLLLTEVLGYKPTTASIPNGYSSPAVIQAMVDAGINEIYTSKPSTKKIKHANSSIAGRYAVTAEMSDDNVLAIVSFPHKRFIISCRQNVLEIAKVLLGKYYIFIRKVLTN